MRTFRVEFGRGWCGLDSQSGMIARAAGGSAGSEAKDKERFSFRSDRGGRRAALARTAEGGCPTGFV